MLRIDVLGFTRTMAGILMALTLAACGEDSVDAAETPSADVPVASTEVLTVVLPLDPIKLSEAYASASTQMQTVPVCPWLSDESAAAAVDVEMTDEPMVRRAVTAQECMWNVNLGFSLNIQTDTVAMARNPSEITYNMDIAPVVQPQEGPGSDAVALLDPTWDAENPRPFGFVFNSDGRQFRIITTGVETSIDRLHAVADEIVAVLPTATPFVESGNKGPTLDPCVYEVATIVALFNGPPDNAVKVVSNQAGSTCTYRGFAGSTRIALTVGFSGDPLVPRIDAGPEFVPIDGFGTDVYVYDQSDLVGERNSLHGYVVARPAGKFRLDLQVNNPEFPEDIAALILNNLITRTN